MDRMRRNMENALGRSGNDGDSNDNDNKNFENNDKIFELDCYENGYGICIRCRINAGPLCDKCFIILRKMNFKKIYRYKFI